MKNQITFSKLFFLPLIAILCLTSCKKEEVDTIDTLVESYVGTYLVAEDCNGYTDNYAIQISRAYPPGSQVAIRNLYDTGTEVKATVNENNGQLEISNWGVGEPLQSNDQYRVTLESGFGGLDVDRLTLTFQIRVLDMYYGESATLSCTIIGSK